MYTQIEVNDVLKYEEIANVLRERIKSQIYPPDSFLPNQVQLVEEFSVSRMTIKKAINILTMEGLVYAQRGSGTKVLNHPFVNRDTSILSNYQGLSTEMMREHRSLESQVIEFKVDFPDKNIQERLMIDAEQPIYKIIRLRILDGEPFILEYTYMPVNLVPGLKKIHAANSIYSYVKDELGIKFAGAYRTIMADISSEFDQQYLQCKKTDPVLEIQQIIYLNNGQPLEFSCSRNRYDVRAYSYLDVKE